MIQTSTIMHLNPAYDPSSKLTGQVLTGSELRLVQPPRTRQVETECNQPILLVLLLGQTVLRSNGFIGFPLKSIIKLSFYLLVMIIAFFYSIGQLDDHLSVRECSQTVASIMLARHIHMRI